LYDNIKLQVVDSFANPRAGLDQFDLGGRRRLGDLLSQHAADIRDTQQSFFFASTCNNAFAWYTGVTSTAYAAPASMKAPVTAAISYGR
jgi:hypothetical protein